jgi:hypothetical protein
VSAKTIPNLLTVDPGPHQRADVSRDLAKLGRVTDLGGSDGLLLLEIDDASDARETWRRVHDAIGARAVVRPVLADDRGGEQYATGEIVVRFTEPPSDAALKRFAKAHALRLRGRNEYVAQQVVFEPADPGAGYIPDLVTAITRDESVQQAWPNTRARYRRG